MTNLKIAETIVTPGSKDDELTVSVHVTDEPFDREKANFSCEIVTKVLAGAAEPLARVQIKTFQKAIQKAGHKTCTENTAALIAAVRADR